jgi:hypothetical protein
MIKAAIIRLANDNYDNWTDSSGTTSLIKGSQHIALVNTDNSDNDTTYTSAVVVYDTENMGCVNIFAYDYEVVEYLDNINYGEPTTVGDTSHTDNKEPMGITLRDIIGQDIKSIQF